VTERSAGTPMAGSRAGRFLGCRRHSTCMTWFTPNLLLIIKLSPAVERFGSPDDGLTPTNCTNSRPTLTTNVCTADVQALGSNMSTLSFTLLCYILNS